VSKDRRQAGKASRKKTQTAGKARRRAASKGKRQTRQQEAAQLIASSDSLTFISKDDIQRHIYESLRPLQHLAEQARLPFISYLLRMAMEESNLERDRDDE
jgi:hypothetical protein